MALDAAGLRLLFEDARTHRVWKDEPVDDELLRQLYALVKLGPTSANSQPIRLAFVKSRAAKARLAPALDAGNVERTMTAPVTAIVAFDRAYYTQLDRLNPHGKGVLAEKAAREPAEARDRSAEQSATLQAGYLILAARALGLDCGPMGGFDAAKVDAEFFGGRSWKTFLLVNLGHGDASKLRPRAPRLEFEDACVIE
jgi:3-hydroxypropanoate dehydrogenase